MIGAQISPQELIDSLVEERGGIARFSAAQVQLARVAIKMMADLGRAGPSQTGQIATALVSLLAKLPPVVPQQREVRPFRAGMSVAEIADEYARMIRDPDYAGAEGWDTEAPTIEAVAEPAKRRTPRSASSA